MNTKGQRITPAVMLKLLVSPNNMIFAGLNPNVASKENILAPINSATMAFVKKKVPKIRNSLFLRLTNSVDINPKLIQNRHTKKCAKPFFIDNYTRINLQV
jgi:hypothetical protein